ncbi:hypothetical protein HY641_04160 [Candidatus Woesearchaeota archaeon]|nr:hypothetical protein [Candidatus Woesearchaeota archaeon]
MVRAQIATVAAVVISLLWIFSILFIPLVMIALNGLLIYVLGLRSLVEINLGSGEKYAIFALIALLIVLIAPFEYGLLLPFTLFLLLTIAMVKVFEAVIPVLVPA